MPGGYFLTGWSSLQAENLDVISVRGFYSLVKRDQQESERQMREFHVPGKCPTRVYRKEMFRRSRRRYF